MPSKPGEDVRVSATAYLSYLQCPARADARFQGKYGRPSRASFVGSIAHQIFRRHLQSGPVDPVEFDQACREEIGGSSRLNGTMAELRIKPSELGGVFQEVRALYERFVRFPQEGFDGAEIVFDIEAAPGVQLVGQVDAVYRHDLGGFRLVDWKTGELGEARDQMGFYALLWALDRDEVPAQLEAVSVKTGERYSSVPSAADIEKTADAVTGMIDTLRSNWGSGTEFTRVGGPWCGHCPILEGCQEGESTVRILAQKG